MDRALSPNFQRIFETAPHLYLVLQPNKQFTVAAASDAYLAATGMTRDFVLDRSFFEVCEVGRAHEDSAREVKTSLEEVVRTKTESRLIIQEDYLCSPEVQDQDTKKRYWSMVNTPVLDDKNEVQYVIHQVEDVTSFYEEARRHKSIQEDLVASIKYRDDFLSVATHELKTPIATMLLKLQILKRLAARESEIKSNSVHNALDPILNQVHRLTRMIGDLLDVSRISNKKLRLDLDALDLCQIIYEVVKRVQELAQEHDSEITIGQCTAVIGYWDQLRLEQVFTNLITNAIKYGRGNPVRIEVEPADDFVLIHIVDQGIGIAEQDQKRIFERFERRTKQHEQQSLGLGLFIVHEIVTAHGGDVWVESKLGEGSRFTVKLPRHQMRQTSSSERELHGKEI